MSILTVNELYKVKYNETHTQQHKVTHGKYKLIQFCAY